MELENRHKELLYGLVAEYGLSSVLHALEEYCSQMAMSTNDDRWKSHFHGLGVYIKNRPKL